MAKKLKKANERRGLSPKAKFTLVNVFKGLISNQAVIDGSKESAWWVAAIFLVFSIFLPLVPNFVSLSNANGANFISTYNFGLDQEMTRFAYTMDSNNVELMVEGGKLHYYENGTEKPEKFEDLTQLEYTDPVTGESLSYFQVTFDKLDHEYHYVNSVTGQVDIRVFTCSDTNLRKTVKALTQQYFKVGTVLNPTDDKDEKHYLPNLVIFTPTTFAVAVYKANTTTQAATSYGGLNWVNTSKKVGIIERLLGDGVDKVTTLSETDFVNQYSASSFKEFKKICKETYLYQKEITKWQTTGIYAGIYAGIIVFLGIMVFILTRGKTNPYKFLNVWHCQKISWWASASPAILGTILSLIFAGNSIGQMAFILLVSLRIMWLSMKQLRPVYNQ